MTDIHVFLQLFMIKIFSGCNNIVFADLTQQYTFFLSTYPDSPSFQPSTLYTELKVGTNWLFHGPTSASFCRSQVLPKIWLDRGGKFFHSNYGLSLWQRYGQIQVLKTRAMSLKINSGLIYSTNILDLIKLPLLGWAKNGLLCCYPVLTIHQYSTFLELVWIYVGGTDQVLRSFEF